jgi:hypothetical protein
MIHYGDITKISGYDVPIAVTEKRINGGAAE